MILYFDSVVGVITIVLNCFTILLLIPLTTCNAGI